MTAHQCACMQNSMSMKIDWRVNCLAQCLHCMLACSVRLIECFLCIQLIHCMWKMTAISSSTCLLRRPKKQLWRRVDSPMQLSTFMCFSLNTLVGRGWWCGAFLHGTSYLPVIILRMNLRHAVWAYSQWALLFAIEATYVPYRSWYIWVHSWSCLRIWWLNNIHKVLKICVL